MTDLESSSDTRAIVDAAIRLAHAMSLRVFTEGAETEGQRPTLLDFDCDELQGYLFARPMPAGELLAWTLQRQGEAELGFAPSVIDTAIRIEPA